jgi:hypothetical protein
MNLRVRFAQQRHHRPRMTLCFVLSGVLLIVLGFFAVWNSQHKPSFRPVEEEREGLHHLPQPTLASTNSSSLPDSDYSDYYDDYDDYEFDPLLDLDPFDPLASVKGPATASLYSSFSITPIFFFLPSDNLQNDSKYISSWLSAEWSRLFSLSLFFTTVSQSFSSADSERCHDIREPDLSRHPRRARSHRQTLHTGRAHQPHRALPLRSHL